MANWSEIKAKISKTAGKVVAKTEETANTATLHVKLKGIESKISDKYETLGRLYYKNERVGGTEDKKISETLDEIDGLIAERRAMRAEIEADKQRRADAKAERAAEKEAEKAEAAREKAEAEKSDAENAENK